jgi:hypothetical protein
MVQYFGIAKQNQTGQTTVNRTEPTSVYWLSQFENSNPLWFRDKVVMKDVLLEEHLG